MSLPDLPENAVQPASRPAWRRWLERHHTREQGVWLVMFKKSSGRQTVDYNAAVEEALCFGWIDSKPRLLDESRSMLWIAPRKARSAWSAANKVRVARLEASGLIAPAGAAKIADAKRSGAWSRLEAVDRLEVPADLARAFRAHPGSAAHFDAFPPSAKKGILEWIQNAKRDETRAARVNETARLAALNERANQWRPKS